LQELPVDEQPATNLALVMRKGSILASWSEDDNDSIVIAIGLGGASTEEAPHDSLRLAGGTGLPPGTVDAIEYARTSIGTDLRAAREHAGLSQIDLASRASNMSRRL
jgi:hypothetical protein